MNTTVEHQPRERAVPCTGCGFSFDRHGLPVPRSWTWAISGLCDREKAA